MINTVVTVGQRWRCSVVCLEELISCLCQWPHAVPNQKSKQKHSVGIGIYLN